MPVQCEYYALEGLSDLLSTVRIVKRAAEPRDWTWRGVLLTMYDGRTNLSLQVAEEVKRHFPGKVFATVIPRNVRLSEAPSHGKPVNAYDGSSRGCGGLSAIDRGAAGNTMTSARKGRITSGLRKRAGRAVGGQLPPGPDRGLCEPRPSPRWSRA